MDKIKIAKARLEAANLRLRAAHRDHHSQGYLRQAQHPAYPGQEEVCMGKYEIEQSLSERDRAQADLIIAEAEGGGNG